MKKNYSAPACKARVMYTGKIMDVEIGSDGDWSQGVTGGEGVDNEARIPGGIF